MGLEEALNIVSSGPVCSVQNCCSKANSMIPHCVSTREQTSGTKRRDSQKIRG